MTKAFGRQWKRVRWTQVTMTALLGTTLCALGGGSRAWARTRPVDVNASAAGAGRASPSSAAALNTVVYNNGTVISPQLGCLAWGSFSTTEVTGIETYLTGLQQYLSNQDFTVGGMEPSIRQYGTWGASFSGSCVTDTSIPSGVVDAAAIKAKISAVQQRTSNPLQGYSPETVILVFTKGIQMDANYGQPTKDGWCAYHTTAGTERYWAIMPFPTVSGCFFGLTSTQALQKSASHEIFEAATDPATTGGWYAGDVTHEVADDCNGLSSSITLPNGTTGVLNPVMDNIAQSCSIYTPSQTAPLAVVKTGSNTLNVLAEADTGALKSITGDGVNWGSPQPRGGTMTDAPAAISSDGQTIDVFVRGLDGSVWRWFFDGANWTGPSSLGGVIVGPPSASYSASGRKLVFARGLDGAVWQLTGTSSGWSWSPLGMPSGVRAISPPQVFFRSGSISDLYFTGTNGHLYQMQVGSDIPVWFDLGGVVLNRVSEVTRASNASRVDVFVDGPVNGAGGSIPYWLTQNPARGFQSLDGIVVGAPSTVPLGSSAIRAFARGAGGLSGSGLYQNVTTDGTTWGGWSQLDTVNVSSAPLAFTPDLSTVSVFVRRVPDRKLLVKRFDGANWQSIVDLGLTVR